MSLIFPKKEILYAPMLGTLGGGSARGMGRGLGGGGGNFELPDQGSYQGLVGTFSQQEFNYTGSIGTYTIPYTGTYEIEMAGGRGGASADTSYAPSGFSNSSWRGKGNKIEFRVNLDEGQVLNYVVANLANDCTSGNGANGGGSGGGGSFMWLGNSSDNAYLIAAAGGGGGGSILNTSGSVSNLYGYDGNTGRDGTASKAGYYGGTNGGDGRGLGGGAGNSNYTAKGWNTMIAAMDFSGRGTSGYGSVAGYGGGGLMLNGDHAGGGGGGYSGGGYSNYGTNTGTGNSDGRNGGGGGGSYISDDVTRYSNTNYGTQNGAGYIRIRASYS